MVEDQVEVMNDLLEKVGEPAVAIPSIRLWLKDWLAEKETSKAETTAERYRMVIEDFLKTMAERADKPLTVLTAQDVQRFMAKRQKESVHHHAGP